MKVLKILGGIVALFLAFYLITPLFLQNDFAVEKSITIEKPKEEVFGYIKMIKNQGDYSVWQKMDPDMKKEFKGEDGTVGFVSAWDSQNENVGVGEQEITKLVEGERMDMELRFKTPWEATNQAYMITESKDSTTTTVKWGFTGRMDYPSNIAFLFMDMESAVGNDLQAGLDNLKVLLEKE